MAARNPARFLRDEQGRLRVRVVSAAGVEVLPGIYGADPEVARPNIGKLGWCEERAFSPVLMRANPRIELDDGGVLWGYECWWEPVEQEEPQ